MIAEIGACCTAALRESERHRLVAAVDSHTATETQD